jgi:hypothetical protein
MTAERTRLFWVALALACSRQSASPAVSREAVPAEQLLEQDFGHGAAPAEPEPMAAPTDPGQTISGRIVLVPARRADVARGDTIFISARRTGAFPGTGSLLAAQRLEAGDFPLAFELGARDAMMPGTAFEGQVNITVRVDKDGDPLTRRRGDVYGQLANVRVGTHDLVLRLDRLQSDDQTLAAGHLDDRAGLPPGHP